MYLYISSIPCICLINISHKCGHVLVCKDKYKYTFVHHYNVRTTSNFLYFWNNKYVLYLCHLLLFVSLCGFLSKCSSYSVAPGHPCIQLWYIKKPWKTQFKPQHLICSHYLFVFFPLLNITFLSFGSLTWSTIKKCSAMEGESFWLKC